MEIGWLLPLIGAAEILDGNQSLGNLSEQRKVFAYVKLK